MVDNFDINVARRRPNVANKKRPLRPWDIVTLPLDDGDGHDEPAQRDAVEISNGVRPVPDTEDDFSASTDEARDGGAVSSGNVDRGLVNADEGVDGEETHRHETVSSTRAGASQNSTTTPDSSAVSVSPSARYRAEAVSKRAGESKTFVSPSSNPVSKPLSAASSATAPSSSRAASDLSNAINIHSNFCKLDNDVSDILFPRLSPSAQCVYLRLYRQSFGWNRNWAAESLPKLTKSCNLSLQTVRKAIKELELAGCIRKDFSDYHKATVYRIFLPAEIYPSSNRHTNTAMAYSDTLQTDSSHDTGEISDRHSLQYQKDDPLFSDTVDFSRPPVKKLDDQGARLRPQDSVIQSIFFSGTSIYTILEGDGSLPKNISIYMTDKHLVDAVTVVDEFYDSIGFSIVSRAVYRKSVIDYFDLVKAGFTADDIRYAVRWTFKNSRSRPESFSLIKHTMHLAMDDLIRDLRQVSGEKDVEKEKREAMRRTTENAIRRARPAVEPEELALWEKVVEDLRNELNDHSFKAFIEPLRLVAVDSTSATLEAPEDSLSWIADHYRDIIKERYSTVAGREVTIAFERT